MAEKEKKQRDPGLIWSNIHGLMRFPNELSYQG